MSSSDLDTLLAPVSADAPTGADLEYDPAATELGRLAQGKPEQQIGTTIVPAEEPDWKVVKRKATEILARSKDLNVACHLTRALLRTDGWMGFADGLTLLRGLIERYWDKLYPALDPDDGDPQSRITALLGIADDTIQAAVRTMPLISSRTVGKFSLKDIEIATGDAPPDKNATGQPPTTALIEGIVMNCDLPQLEDTTKAVKACVDNVAGLEADLGTHVDAAQAPSFAKLSAILRKAHQFLSQRLAARAPAAAGADGADGGAIGQGEGGEGMRSVGGPFTGGIGSREDVVRAIDAISAYYSKHEPANPIPLFMARCKRLVMMNFMDIVRELVPDAIKQVEMLQGTASE